MQYLNLYTRMDMISFIGTKILHKLKDLRLRQLFTFQQKINPKNAARDTTK